MNYNLEPPFYFPKNDLDYVLNSVGNRWELFREKTILLTGGTGFIGKTLISSLLYANIKLNLNVKIKIITRNPQLFLNKFQEIKKISFIIK